MSAIKKATEASASLGLLLLAMVALYKAVPQDSASDIAGSMKFVTKEAIPSMSGALGGSLGGMAGSVARRLQVPGVITDAFGNVTTPLTNTTPLGTPAFPPAGTVACISDVTCATTYTGSPIVMVCTTGVCQPQQSLGFWESFKQAFTNPDDPNTQGVKLESTGSYSGSSVFLMLIMACIYNAMVMKKIEDVHPRRAFGEREWSEMGLFDCFSDCNTCLYVYFMTPIVAAKNFDKTGVMDFWPACILIHCTYQCWCVGACVRTALAQKMKEEFNIKSSFLTDCCLNMFCYPCEVGRESMFVDRDMGITIGCPCKVEMDGGMGMGPGMRDGGMSMDSGSDYGFPNQGYGQQGRY